MEGGVGFDPNVEGAKRVHFCPGCGRDDIQFNPFALDNSATPHNPTFDAFCTYCGWSGDISPDIPLGWPNG